MEMQQICSHLTTYFHAWFLPKEVTEKQGKDNSFSAQLIQTAL